MRARAHVLGAALTATIVMALGGAASCGLSPPSDAPAAPAAAQRYGWLGPTGAGGTGGSSASPVIGNGSPPNPFTLIACTGSAVQDLTWSSGSWACGTAGSGTIVSTSDLLIGDGTGNAEAYAGSSPTACTAGKAVTTSALSAAGALTATCTAIVPASTADLLVGSNGSSVAYAGTGACTAGSAITALSAAGAATCTAFGTSSLTNAAGSGVIPVTLSTGNLGSSALTDNGTTVSDSEPLTWTSTSGNANGPILGGTTSLVANGSGVTLACNGTPGATTCVSNTCNNTGGTFKTTNTGASSCTVTWVGSPANAPSCTVSAQTAIAAMGYSENTTALTVTATTITASDNIDYVCVFH